MFRQVAPRYDLMNHLLSLNIDRYWRWRTVRQLTSNDRWNAVDGPVLDVCTGTGDLALALRSRLPAEIGVVGSDFCRAMLQLAQQKQAKSPARNPPVPSSRSRASDKPLVPFVEADSQQLPFADNSFRAVTVAFGLRNVRDTDRGLSEMIRVCRPGGQVVVLEFSNPRLPGFRQLYQTYFTHVLPRIGQWLARNDKDAYRYLQKSVGQFPDGQQLLQRMSDVGMVDCSFRPLTGGVATIYVGHKPRSIEQAPPADQPPADQPPTDQPASGEGAGS